MTVRLQRGAVIRRLAPAALMPAGAFAVHQLRYWLAYGHRAGSELAAQGHSYLHSVVPWIVLLIAFAVGTFLVALGRALGGARLASSLHALVRRALAALRRVPGRDLHDAGVPRGAACDWPSGGPGRHFRLRRLVVDPGGARRRRWSSRPRSTAPGVCFTRSPSVARDVWIAAPTGRRRRVGTGLTRCCRRSRRSLTAGRAAALPCDLALAR